MYFLGYSYEIKAVFFFDIFSQESVSKEISTTAHVGISKLVWHKWFIKAESPGLCPMKKTELFLSSIS